MVTTEKTVILIGHTVRQIQRTRDGREELRVYIMWLRDPHIIPRAAIQSQLAGALIQNTFQSKSAPLPLIAEYLRVVTVLFVHVAICQSFEPRILTLGLTGLLADFTSLMCSLGHPSIGSPHPDLSSKRPSALFLLPRRLSRNLALPRRYRLLLAGVPESVAAMAVVATSVGAGFEPGLAG